MASIKIQYSITIFIVALVIGLFLIIRFSSEDTWICENGTWVKHGNPSTAAPSATCPSANQNIANTATNNTITTFQDCVNAGYAIQESYPARCVTDDGRSFTQYIGNELEKTDLIIIDSPRPTATISSPLTITGKARGTWFFEAEFPVTLNDENGTQIGFTTARAQSDWTTDDFVDFIATLSFEESDTQYGILTLHKDNPSGLSENEDSLIVPVTFLPRQE